MPETFTDPPYQPLQDGQLALHLDELSEDDQARLAETSALSPTERPCMLSNSDTLPIQKPIETSDRHRVGPAPHQPKPPIADRPEVIVRSY